MQDQLGLLDIFKVLWKWKWPIVILCFLAGVISIAASLRLDDYYKASTTFIPASQEVFKPEALFGGEGVKYIYGGREDVDRMSAVAESQEVRDFLIDSFELYEVYGIDPENPKANFFVNQSLSGLYKVLKTKFNAIEITVEDVDPVRASRMATAAREKSGLILERIMVQRLETLLSVMNQDIASRKVLRESLDDSLSVWRERYGIINFNSQSEVLAELITTTEASLNKKRAQVKILKQNPEIPRDTIAMMEAEVEGLAQQFKSLTSSDGGSSFNIANLSKGKELVKSAQQRLDIETNHLNYQGLKADQYATTINSGFETFFVIDEASIPYIKSRPRRSRIVMGAVFMTFVLGVLGVLIFDRIRDIDWKSEFS